jgi:carbon starvation protein
MNVLFILLAMALLLYIAYRTYGSFLSNKVFKLDDKNVTPAVEFEDGLDYEPTDASLLLGQQFSAIAAAGPVTGPIIAGIAFGWVPALLWILFGSIFIGGVHDMGALVASIRNKGKSITETVRTHIGKSAWILFNLFIFIALVLIIVAFTDITTSAFVNTVTMENGEVVGGGAIATSSVLYLCLPMIMGLLMRYTKLNLTWATIIFLPLVGVAIWAGKYIPINMPTIGSLDPKDIWNIIIIVYCIIANIIPVWLLLQPRGHLCGYFLYAAILVAFIGIIIGGFKVQYPAFTGASAFGGNNPMFPMLFITVACGACSGFHALVSSGTTSKQLKKETDAKVIGYGAMLLEGLVAVIALITVMIVTKGDELLGKSPNFVYSVGIGSFMEKFGISKAFGISFGLMAYTTFVYDTLDVCTRLGRFIIQELTGLKGWLGKVIGTIIIGGVPIILMTINLTDTAGNPVSAWSIFWKTFGASNQLLAALALIGITVWLKNTASFKKAYLLTFIPAIFMFIMSTWALLRMFFVNMKTADGTFGFPAGPNIILPILCFIYALLAIWMMFETAKSVTKPVETVKAKA